MAVSRRPPDPKGKRRPPASAPAVLGAVLGAFGLLVLTPGAAWAWGPTTHIYLGTAALANLAALPAVLRELLAAYPYEFLYGNLSADITLAKKYVRYSRHCHRWDVGFALLERAETRPLRSFALGYLSHLAADTLAHNHFVPRQLLVTSSTRQLGHAYWEFRFDAHLDSEHLRLAREIVGRDHAAPDELLEAVLAQAIFSFRTNKRIFRRMIHLSNDERWQILFEKVVEKSRWDLPEDEVQRYLEVARHYVFEFLNEGTQSRACGLDPIGEENLRLAKKIRRRTIRDSRRESGRLLDRSGYSEEVTQMAEIFFELPRVPERPGSTEASPARIGTIPRGSAREIRGGGGRESSGPQEEVLMEGAFWQRFAGWVPVPAAAEAVRSRTTLTAERRRLPAVMTRVRAAEARPPREVPGAPPGARAASPPRPEGSPGRASSS